MHFGKFATTWLTFPCARISNKSIVFYLAKNFQICLKFHVVLNFFPTIRGANSNFFGYQFALGPISFSWLGADFRDFVQKSFRNWICNYWRGRDNSSFLAMSFFYLINIDLSTSTNNEHKSFNSKNEKLLK